MKEKVKSSLPELLAQKSKNFHSPMSINVTLPHHMYSRVRHLADASHLTLGRCVYSIVCAFFDVVDSTNPECYYILFGVDQPDQSNQEVAE